MQNNFMTMDDKTVRRDLERKRKLEEAEALERGTWIPMRTEPLWHGSNLIETRVQDYIIIANQIDNKRKSCKVAALDRPSMDKCWIRIVLGLWQRKTYLGGIEKANDAIQAIKQREGDQGTAKYWRKKNDKYGDLNLDLTIHFPILGIDGLFTDIEDLGIGLSINTVLLKYLETGVSPPEDEPAASSRRIAMAHHSKRYLAKPPKSKKVSSNEDPTPKQRRRNRRRLPKALRDLNKILGGLTLGSLSEPSTASAAKPAEAGQEFLGLRTAKMLAKMPRNEHGDAEMQSLVRAFDKKRIRDNDDENNDGADGHVSKAQKMDIDVPENLE